MNFIFPYKQNFSCLFYSFFLSLAMLHYKIVNENVTKDFNYNQLADINKTDIISWPTLLAGRHYQSRHYQGRHYEGRHFGADIMPWKGKIVQIEMNSWNKYTFTGTQIRGLVHDPEAKVSCYLCSCISYCSFSFIRWRHIAIRLLEGIYLLLPSYIFDLRVF